MDKQFELLNKQANSRFFKTLWDGAVHYIKRAGAYPLPSVVGKGTIREGLKAAPGNTLRALYMPRPKATANGLEVYKRRHMVRNIFNPKGLHGSQGRVKREALGFRNQINPMGGGFMTTALAGSLPVAAWTSVLRSGSLLKGDLELSTDRPTSPTASELALNTAGGAAVGGLSSLLYGKLRDRPNVKRDLLVALAGGAIGAGSSLAKYAEDQDNELIVDQAVAKILKNANVEKTGFSLPFSLPGFALAALGIFATEKYISHGSEKRVQKINEETQRLLREAVQKHVGNRAALIGAGTGAAVGGIGSAAWGKLSDNPNLRRDLLMAGIGAGGGALTGKYLSDRMYT